MRPRMGIMLQESGFSPDLTVRESVAPDRHAHRAHRHRRPGARRRRPHPQGRAPGSSQLSGGEKRRLDFATAVYGGPELIFLDEPTTGLDIQSRDALWDAVDRLREDGVHHRAHHALPGRGAAAGRPHRAHARGHPPPRGHGRRADADPAGGHPLRPAARRSGAAARRARANGGTFHIETFASAGGPAPPPRLGARPRRGAARSCEAGPTRLDDVFRALDAA